MSSSTSEPLVQTASLSLEHGFGSILLTGGLLYSRGKNVLVGNSAADPDAIPLSALAYGVQLNNIAFSQSLREYPQFIDFNLNNLYPIGRYVREASYLHAEKRMSHGVAAYVTYTYSKQLDDYSGPYGVQDYFNRNNDWSLSPGNRPKTLEVDYTWDLPLGSGGQLLRMGGWCDRFVQGWSLSGSASVFSGTPTELRPLFNNTGGVVAALQVNAVPGVNPKVENPGPDLWFNPAAFAQPADFTLGDLSRTDPVLRNPMFQNYDLRIEKRLAIDLEKTMELSAVALNFLNHANWNNPDPVIGPSFSPNVGAGHIIGSTGGRIIQLMLRFSF